MLNVNLGGVMPLGYFFINLRGTLPLSGCKGTANRRQYKIKKELFSFLLVRCSVPYLKVLQILDKTKKIPPIYTISGIFINY
jgi:hypothetical protein